MVRYLGARALVGVALLVGGCAGAQIKLQSVEKVKTVAIVNVTSNTEMKKSDGKYVRIGGMGGLAEAKQRDRALMETVYDILVAKVDGAGFTTVKRVDVSGNAKFVEAYNKLTRIDLGGDPGAFVVNGGHFSLGVMEQRKQLLDALGVDAVAGVEITYTTGNTSGVSIGGFGALKYFPQASVNFFLYDRSEPDAIYADYRCYGDVASDGFQETMGVADMKDPGPILREAAEHAFTKLFQRFQTAKTPPPPAK